MKDWNDKYRPKRLTDMVGHREAFAEIEGFILSGEIPPLLFHGQAGTGKTTAAEVIGYMILGDEPNGNFIEINASDNRKIDDMRKVVIRAIKHMPLFAAMKIILLDEFDGVIKEAQDLLKRPMEKAKTTLFIITCNDLSSIIKPIISRCAVFEFKPLSEADIITGLKRIAGKENLNLTESVFSEIAKKTNGDMRQAINELQKVAASNNRNVEIERIVQQYMKQPAGMVTA